MNREAQGYLYWAQALAAQDTDPELKATFSPIAQAMTSQTAAILDELNGAQGSSQDIGGYYKPDKEMVARAMRPSKTLNSILATL